MPFTKYTNLDFDQIKTSIKDYLRANSNFTGFDFEGSNFSVLIDTLAYNTYITAFNSNMIVNESFLESATLRENVVSLAKNIGYLPRSRSAAKAKVTITATIDNPDITSVTLKAGNVCIGVINDSSYIFSILNDIETSVITLTDGTRQAVFEEIDIYQGTLINQEFRYDSSLNQKFILDNSFIDTSTLSVYINKEGSSGTGIEYSQVSNILNIDKNSRIYFLQEIQDERYQIIFGDGFFGKKLGTTFNDDGTVIRANYIVTDGPEGNGARSFSFTGTLKSGNVFVPATTTVALDQKSQNGAEIESIESIKYYAPQLYSSQYRAVTARDYEAIIKRIYPDTETVTVIGGEELDPPEFGTVSISIKPKNGTYVSDFNKDLILSKLKQYSVSGINQKIVDVKILYVEIDSSIYYDYSQTSDIDGLRTRVVNSLEKYAQSIDINKFGGRFRYSKILHNIDKVDNAITSNITKVIIRRDLKAAVNQFAQYELCFGNQFHVKANGYNIKSTGFYINGESDVVYLTDIPNADKKTGTLSIVKPTGSDTVKVVVTSAGTVDYVKGEINLGTVNITGTVKENNIIEVQAFPESNDIIGLKDLYLMFSVNKSTINMLRDVMSSGDEISGTKFIKNYYTSSYSNGKLIRE